MTRGVWHAACSVHDPIMNAAIDLPRLVAWLLSLPLLHDGTPLHAPIHRPEAAVHVIAQAALETEDPPMYAALLDVFAARESAYRPTAVGDHGRSCGAWQTPCARTPMGKGAALEQARLAIRIFRASFAGCPDHPLALYETGRCMEWGSHRMTEVRAELAVPLPDADVDPVAWTP